MSEPIGPGDWIELVGPFEGDGAALAARYQAAGYRVAGAYSVGLISVCTAVTDAMRLPDGRVVPGLQTRDVKVFRAGRECWCAAHQWRPIYRRGDAEQLTQTLLQSVPATAPEPATA
jgi:hypothetical protein